MLDATPSSMFANVSVQFEREVWVQLPRGPTFVDTEPPALCLMQSVNSDADGGFLPDAEIHSLIDSTLNEIGEAMETSASEKHGGNVYVEVKLALHINASVQVLLEGEVDELEQVDLATWIAETPAPSSHAPFGITSFRDLISQRQPLTKSMLEDLVFVVYGGYMWADSTRTIWFKRIPQHPFSYARILSRTFSCPAAPAFYELDA